MMRGQPAAAQGLLAAAHPGQGGGQGRRMMRGQPAVAQGLPAAAQGLPAAAHLGQGVRLMRGFFIGRRMHG